mmetsp:Transcript_55473/g.97192  ORF Transcript_55473/g.97192 Transcript_55473/m.97192 type:complete len:94 (-) Transcript_55473:219-500(-)
MELRAEPRRVAAEGRPSTAAPLAVAATAPDDRVLTTAGDVDIASWPPPLPSWLQELPVLEVGNGKATGEYCTPPAPQLARSLLLSVGGQRRCC